MNTQATANHVSHCGYDINRFGGLWHVTDRDGEEHGYPGFDELRDALRYAEQHNQCKPAPASLAGEAA